MTHHLVATAAAALTLLLGAGSRAENPASGLPDPALERARTAARELAVELKGRLEQELAAGGPVVAARVCSEVAQSLAAARAGEGLAIRRVSERPRNPADRPDAWESAQLARWTAQQTAGENLTEVAQRVEIDGAAYLRYLQPLRIAAPCLACHGDPATFSPELRALLAERYPEDPAVGYRLDELRGAISVTVRTTLPGS